MGLMVTRGGNRDDDGCPGCRRGHHEECAGYGCPCQIRRHYNDVRTFSDVTERNNDDTAVEVPDE